jgi:hypothetical protein
VLDISTSVFTPPAQATASLSAEAAERETRRLERILTDVREIVTELETQESFPVDVDPMTVQKKIAELEDRLEQLEDQIELREGRRHEAVEQLLAVHREVDDLTENIRDSVKALNEKSTSSIAVSVPEEDRDGKDVLLLEVSAPRLLVQPIGGEVPAREIRERSLSGRQRQLDRHLRDFPPTEYHVLILLKPSAFGLNEVAHWVAVLEGRGYRVGYEPLEEERTVIRTDRGG